MKLFGIKFHVPSRGILGNNNIWRIYEDLDQTFAKTHYVEHFKVLNVDSWTGELKYRIGFSLLCEGHLYVGKTKEGVLHGIIHDGTYENEGEYEDVYTS
jgi:hypothetical protein